MAGRTFILQRYSDNKDSTLGLLFEVVKRSPGEDYPRFFCYALEDQYQAVKVMKETRIPAGIYNVDIQKNITPKTEQYREKYPWFRNHIEIKNVKDFVGVYIHIGNTDEDTDACLLLGDSADNNQITSGSIVNSTSAFKRFYESVYGSLPITLIVRDEPFILDGN